MTGPDTTATGTDIKWTGQNVWNNDGHTAFLRNNSGVVVAKKDCATLADGFRLVVRLATRREEQVGTPRWMT